MAGKIVKSVCLIRHGQSTSNFSGKNSPLATLNLEGLKQCATLNEKLRENNAIFDAVFVSPLQRCLETFQIAFHEVKHGEMQVSDELREYESYDPAFYEAQFKPLLSGNLSIPIGVKSEWLQAESERDFIYKRLMHFIMNILGKTKGNRIAIVGHAIWFQYFQQYIFNKKTWQETAILPNGGTFEVELSFFDNRQPTPAAPIAPAPPVQQQQLKQPSIPANLMSIMNSMMPAQLSSVPPPESRITEIEDIDVIEPLPKQKEKSPSVSFNELENDLKGLKVPTLASTEPGNPATQFEPHCKTCTCHS